MYCLISIAHVLLRLCIYFLECAEDSELSVAHNLILGQYQQKIKDTLVKVSSEHKDLHGSVSKVGKTIDRVMLII